MVNLLFTNLPTSKDGISINTSFKNFIYFEIIMNNKKMEEEEKIKTILLLFFDNKTILYNYKDYKRLLQIVMDFYSCSFGRDHLQKFNKNEREEREEEPEELKKIKEEEREKRKKRGEKKIYCFDEDSELIYSAFLQQYNIDLQTAEMHWYRFKALFNSLTENTKFVEVMKYRAVDLTKIKDKDEKSFYAKQKEFYKLKGEAKTEEEKENEFASMFW